MRRKLERLFAYRHAATRADLEWTARYGTVRRMRIAISGASGLVGRALEPFLQTQGHEVLRLVRRPARSPQEISWNPSEGKLDDTRLRGVDAIIHLAGENIASGRWTASRRRAILASRLESTRTLISALQRLRHLPFVFVSASAVGIYGDRGDETLDEASERGSGFLADVCEAWEREASAVEALDIRSAQVRFGTVLTPAGGALARLCPVVRAGLGGRLGTGRQWMSWIAIDDLVGALYHAILDRRCEGPMNAVAPQATTNADFIATLARVERRPALLPAPAWALKAAFGAMADEALLASTRVVPMKLQSTGFRFRYPSLQPALRHLLGRYDPAG